jgi:hypothetical protein
MLYCTMISSVFRSGRRSGARSPVMILSAALALAGCASPHERTVVLPPAAATPAMAAAGNFFNGQIAFLVTLSGGPGSLGGHNGYRHKASPLSYKDKDDEDRSSFRDNSIGSPLPAVIMKLHLTNHGKVAVKVSVPEFKSVLGNFAVRPDTLSLAPGQSAEADPMISRIGFEGTELPVSLTLQRDDQKENQSVILRLIPGAAPLAPPAE